MVDIEKLSNDFKDLLEAIKKVKIDGKIPEYSDLIDDESDNVSEDGSGMTGQSMTTSGGVMPNAPLGVVMSGRHYGKSYLGKDVKKKKSKK